jgi:hypothetical protein
VLARIFRTSHPEILDLGPMCGETVVYLARRGARVTVEPFTPPQPVPPRRPGQPPPDVPPLRIEQPDGKYQLVLAWEQYDFVPPERLTDFGAELRRVLDDDGWLFLFSHMKPESEADPPARFRLLADDMIVREESGMKRRRRWAHATRDIERSLAGFSIQSVHLQRSQIREFAALKVPLES